MGKNYEYLTKSFFVKMPDGQKKQIKIRAKNAKELEQKYLKKKLEYEMGLLVVNSKTTLTKWVSEWAAIYKKPNVTDKTYNDILALVKLVYLNPIGHLPIKDIKQSNLQKCLNDLEGCSLSKIKKARNYINHIMAKAVENDLIIKNPAVSLTMPMGTKGSRRSLTPEEERLFMMTIDKHPKSLMFAITLACGLRPGEVRALEWQDIDKKQCCVTVNKAVENGNGRKIKLPKSEAGYRTVPIPKWYASLLFNQNTIAMNKLVFPSVTGQVMSTKAYHNGWHSFMREMDILAGATLYRNKIVEHAIDQSLTPYYLRHTYATNLAEADVDLKTAQYLLGHSDIKMTAEIYTHVTSKMTDKAVEKINMIR